MCGKRSASLSLLFLLASSLFSQSFDPVATYPVKGTELNRLEKDLLTAQAELKTSRGMNEQLQTENSRLQELTAKLWAQLQTESADRLADSKIKTEALNGLGTQLKTVFQSWQISQEEAQRREIIIGSVSFFLGSLGGIAFFALVH